MHNVLPPESKFALENSCNRIVGKTIGEIAKTYGVVVPKNLKHFKGWIGQLFEYALGANSGSKPVPDFEHLGIELKTIPISDKLKPLESTYVCNINLHNLVQQTWENSLVKKKISHVLWVPIISISDNIANRIVAAPIFWRPSVEELSVIKGDWHELIEYLALGQVEDIHGKLGIFLQVRPKAANSKSRSKAVNQIGQLYKTLPRGFYLRASFTEQIIKNNYL